MTSNPEKLPLETKQVACDNMVTLTLKLCHQTSLVSYSTENRSKQTLSLSDAICMSEPGVEDPYFIDEHLRVLQERSYLREGISYKRRIDIENIEPDLERLWLEIPGRNKHSEMLLGVLYRAELIQDYQTWLDTVKRLFKQLNVLWDGLIVATGDVNVDMLMPNCPKVRKYINMLKSRNQHEHVQRPTKTTSTSKTLIDHIISNAPNCVSYCNVLPCPTISDHDGPYTCMNARVKRFQPRYKLLRDEKRFDETAFRKN